MTIIEQLEQSVSLPLLGAEQNIAHISLLEQFYALLIARLAQPQVYTQLLQATELPTPVALTTTELSTADTAASSLFYELWQDPDQRKLIIDQLAATHHLDESTTIALITSASVLSYHELKILADGQYLPAFLQQRQVEIRHYLPVWAESVLLEERADSDFDSILDSNLGWSSDSDSVSSESNSDEVATTTIESSKPASTTAATATGDPSEASSVPPSIAIDNSAHSHSVSQFRKTHKRNNRRDLLWRLLLLVAAIAALALMWVLVIEPNYISSASTDESISVEPEAAVTDTVNETVTAPLTPAELLIAVDNSGQLYTCKGVAGSAALQEALSQALVRSFGEQASICELQRQPSVADSLTAVDIELLPSLFTLLKSAPFARLQLQNDIITIESPDNRLSERLLTDMRALAPKANITANTGFNAVENPVTAGEEGTLFANNAEWQNEAQDNDSYNIPSVVNDSNSSNNDNTNLIPDDANNINSTVSSNTNKNASNSTYTGINSNQNNNLPPRPIANTQAIGSMSAAEVDDLANSIIVAERLDNESRVETDIGSN
uniref:hypothetical protein n=1 Tax=uncultured Psychrobacter sp. TaxID=259303 RepID=UPI0026222ECB|nr:hypothetical protein [uncultured Psychrobacter sp.]